MVHLGGEASPTPLDIRVGVELGQRTVCFTFDVERDYRLDRGLTTRGVTEGLPVFLDVFRESGIPFDLMVSAEIIRVLPQQLLSRMRDLVALGCHGLHHVPGYLNRLPQSAQDREIREATRLIRTTYSESPILFRAPNFSANRSTIRVLSSLGYLVDSSILPNRLVRKWRVRKLVDHRGLPEDPYFTDADHFPLKGAREILEVPVTQNRALPGGPLGLGFLHSHGADAFRKAIDLSPGKNVVILGHSWEMVSWEDSDEVAPWVRRASSSRTRALQELIEGLGNERFMNLRGILKEETASETLSKVTPRT